jgi:hypothetical protein
MPASKLNYIVVYKNHSQVYGSSSEKIALESPPPDGNTEEDKNIFFISYEPDSENICLYKLDKQKLQEEQDNINNLKKEKNDKKNKSKKESQY